MNVFEKAVEDMRARNKAALDRMELDKSFISTIVDGKVIVTERTDVTPEQKSVFPATAPAPVRPVTPVIDVKVNEKTPTTPKVNEIKTVEVKSETPKKEVEIDSKTGEKIFICNESTKTTSSVDQAAEYLTKMGYQVSKVPVPQLNSNKLVVTNAALGRVIELYFDVQGRVMYNKRKMIMLDASALATQMGPINYVPELEVGAMMDINDISINAVVEYLNGNAYALVEPNVLKNPLDPRIYEVNRFIDLATIKADQVTPALIDRLYNTIHDEQLSAMVNAIDACPRFRFENFKSEKSFDIVSDPNVMLTALIPKDSASATVRIRYNEKGATVIR